MCNQNIQSHEDLSCHRFFSASVQWHFFCVNKQIFDFVEKLIGRPVAASCLGRIPVYRPKGISLSRSLSHSLTLLLTCLLLARLVTHLSHTLREAWMATCTTRWAGRSSVTPWSSTTSIESRYQRKGWNIFKKCWFCKNYSQGRFHHGNSFARNRQVVS